ncbi:MAG: DUF1501 domain-containing protein [Gemmataceae bacterium]|nr:DUF1501 domain-containing protein [Gemmataceae bacterium]MCS7270088.1 DUF1501 domain-containing protein [Gemmataceae bacterium]MDW8243523.1 DUF1501 domain-containing protein [Thermogemmata sp.]
MTTFPAAPSGSQPSCVWSRRAVLRLGGIGLFGLSYAQLDALAAAPTARQKASARGIIFLHQWGGPGQHETFDPKPEAPEAIRGWHGASATRLPGVRFGEGLPRLAALADRLTVIRCMHHNMKNHNSAGYYSLTGVPPPSDDIRLRDSLDLAPAYGSIVSHLRPSQPGTASFVALPHVIADGSVTPGQHASFLGKAHNPLLITRDPNQPDFQLPELTLPAGLSVERLEHRRSLQQLIDTQARLIEHSLLARGIEENYQRAAALLLSPAFRQAFDLSREPSRLRERYGRTTYGQACLLARRCIEAGARFVNVYFSRSIGGTGGGWDYHGNNGESAVRRLDELLPATDQTLSALLEDLEQRGLLHEVLVVWVGEFGRTPRINNNGGRDHWPQCYCAVLAGGGIRRGYVHGASDKIGAYPTVGLVRPEDLAATLFAALGIDPHTEIRDRLNRPLPISRGQPVRELFA